MDILDLHQKSIDCVMPLLERHFGTLPEGEGGIKYVTINYISVKQTYLYFTDLTSLWLFLY